MQIYSRESARLCQNDSLLPFISNLKLNSIRIGPCGSCHRGSDNNNQQPDKHKSLEIILFSANKASIIIRSDAGQNGSFHAEPWSEDQSNPVIIRGNLYRHVWRFELSHSHPSATQRVWMNYWLHGNYNNTTLSPGDTFNCYPAFAGASLPQKRSGNISPWKRSQELSVNEVHSRRIRTVGGSLRWLTVCSLTCVFCGGLLATHVLTSERESRDSIPVRFIPSRRKRVGGGGRTYPFFLLIKQSKYLNYSAWNQFSPSTSSENLDAFLHLLCLFFCQGHQGSLRSGPLVPQAQLGPEAHRGGRVGLESTDHLDLQDTVTPPSVSACLTMAKVTQVSRVRLIEKLCSRTYWALLKVCLPSKATFWMKRSRLGIW